MKDAVGREIDYLRLSVTDRCNQRCFYCMPDDGVELVGHADLLSFEEIRRVCAILTGRCGVSKIRITGGEPLLRRNLASLIRMLAELPGRAPELVLTTNGILLPGLADELAAAGLSRVNISRTRCATRFWLQYADPAPGCATSNSLSRPHTGRVSSL